MTTSVTKPAGPGALSHGTAARLFSLSSTPLWKRGPGRGGFHPVLSQSFVPSNSGRVKVRPPNAALAVLLLVSLFQQQSAVAQAPNATELSLVIRGPTNVLKVGDEIPIEFVVSNQGPADYRYTDRFPEEIGVEEITLLAKTSSGEGVPDPRLRWEDIHGGAAPRYFALPLHAGHDASTPSASAHSVAMARLGAWVRRSMVSGPVRRVARAKIPIQAGHDGQCLA